MKKILGLDLGTNSIGWALVKLDFDNKQGSILGIGSRIIPMDAAQMGNFDAGNSISQTAERTGFRGIRRLRERHLLRRERLHRVLNILGFLPEHYAKQIDFEKHFGQFVEESEPKLAWVKNENDKYKFLFQSSFNEMVTDFEANGQSIKIPYDWTIYYLRKKALSHKITKEELAWLILNFNQKRGYYQLRGEDDEDATKTAKTRKYFDRQIIKSIVDTNEIYKGLKVLLVELENGNKGKIFKKEIPQWIGLEKNIIATVDTDNDGNDRYEENGLLKQRFSIPTDAEWETEWKLIKLKTEKDLRDSEKTVGTYIYEALLQNPTQKIRGKLVRTIERKFYRTELEQILKKQIELQPELFTEEKFNDCVIELYKNNKEHQNELNGKNFVDLFVKDIIFYQRPLRSQKSNIGNCSLEFRIYKDKDGNTIKEYFKGVPKSNPYYQEFRVLQWLYNLKIYRKDDDTDVTVQFLENVEDYENLFDFLNNRKEIEQKPLITYLLKQKKLKEKAEDYRWNFVEDKKYPCNETKTMISTRLAKVENVLDDFLTSETEYKLWHIIYSVTDKIEYEKALGKFAEKHNLDKNSFVENFKKFPPFKSEYGSFSEKAIKKLLPLMRLGKYWNWENIDERTKDRISKIITGEYDENIKERVREKAINLTKNEDFQGLQLWLAQYVVYDRHSEAEIAGKWKTVADLEQYLDDFKQHSLRNPIVEQVITETLRVVRDIWKHYGQSAENFFDEIHIELGREMKQTAEKRKEDTNRVTENENTNLRIKALLAELQNDITVENVRPYSPTQQDILRIYEEYAISNISDNDSDKEFVLKISKTAQPSSSDLQKYKLWLEQKYRSPYTGQMIPLSKLFTAAYEIEHIIPQSRYFDDSYSNKVICEAEVNKLKDKCLGFEFIKLHKGEIVSISGTNRSVKIFTEEEYKDFISKHYDSSKLRAKKRNLLLDEIPDKMIERQMNDTRHISKFISALLSNIVRIDDVQARKILADAELSANQEEDINKATEIREKAKSTATDDGVNSKNIVPCNGKITTTLKQDWGLNDIWNDLILPRFQRMNKLTESDSFTSKNKNGKDIPDIPLELSKGFQKKRIDHRHHAMDALVIACATRDHVNLLNNQHAKSENSRYDLQHKLRNIEKWTDKDGKERDKFTEFKKPYNNFTVDAKNELEKIVVSFKQNLRVMNKTTNKYEKWVEKNGIKKKEFVEQNGVNLAIRKPMHEETFSGIVNLSWVETGENEITTATRKALDKSFNLEKIEKITDTGIQKILKNYLKQEKFKYEEKNEIKYNSELAFSPEGLEEMNKNISLYNDGRFHQPIFKVRIYEKGSGRFVLGEKGNKKSKYVQGSPNLFFAVYEKVGTKDRMFNTVPLNEVIEHQKQQISESIPKINRTAIPIKRILKHRRKNVEVKFLFALSPNDLVYIPTEDEKENLHLIDWKNKEQIKRIFVVNDFSDTCYFTPNHLAKNIAPKEVDLNFDPIKNKLSGSFDTKTASFEGKQIKDVCIKLKVDRLGNITIWK